MAHTFTATALQDEMLDALCWRVLGKTEKVTEQVLALNPGLADQGPLLTEGQVIALPAVISNAIPEFKMIQLWD